jgi:SAM-dependent methyltransferase
MKRINFGCGTDIKEGFINVDNFAGKGVDVIHDFEQFPYPFENESIDELIAINVLEHLSAPVTVMEEIHRIMKKDGEVTIRVPYYNARDMYTDPTHKAFFSQQSFDYFDPSRRHCQERPYYSTARFSIETTYVYTNILFPFKYYKVKPGLLQKFLLGLAGVFGNVVWVIEFRLKAIK